MSDVVTIGSKEVVPSDEQKQQELREKQIKEAQEKAKKVAENIVKKQFRTPFLQVYNEVALKGKSVEDVIEEVNQKNSNMTKVARDFVVNFETERIKQWIEDEKNGQYYYRVQNQV